MEFHLKNTKFMAQKYLNSSQPAKSKGTPLLNKRHAHSDRAQQTRRHRTPPLFPNIPSGVHSRATEGRLQMTVNVDSPGPAAYPPPSVYCRETTAPSYTFGWKTPPKEGGGRRSWQKTWFQSKNPFTKKADFNRETNWPSPLHYSPAQGSKPANRPSSPHYTFGKRGAFSLVRKDAPNEPAPNRYNVTYSYKQVLQRSPSIIISPESQCQFRWASKGGTPGPGAYNVEMGLSACLPSSPSFFIQGERRPKKHETGPFSTL